MAPITLRRRLAALEMQRRTRPRYVVRWELDGERYDRNPDTPDAKVVSADEDLAGAILIIVRYTDAP